MPPYFCDQKKLQITQHKVKNNFTEYVKAYFDTEVKKLSTYGDNFVWFREGEQSNFITFHFFATIDEVRVIVCTMGSDIFDCLKINTQVNATGGFAIKDIHDNRTINPVLIEFKTEILNWVKDFYNNGKDADNNPLFDILPFDDSQILLALDNEFKAEDDYQRTVDWIFEKLGVTTSFKDWVNQFREKSKSVEAYRIDETRYLPFLPNFDPIFNDALLKAFGIDFRGSTTEFISQEEIDYYKIIEKEVNGLYVYNAQFCGFWNGLVDTADGFLLIIPGIYDIITDRATFKVFLHAIKDLLNNFSSIPDKIIKYDLEKSQYSIYRYEYQQIYELTIFLSLFLPMPKTGIGTRASESLSFFTKAVKSALLSEIILLAYRLGLRIEKTAEEWKLLLNDIVISTGSKEKIIKRIENIVEITAKNPNIIFKLISESRLRKLIEVKLAKGLNVADKLLIQSKLFNKNIAFAEFKISAKGRTIYRELKAYAGHNISELDKLGFSKSPGLRSGESIADFIDKIDGIEIRRFLDTESKILREFEDVHLKQIMQELGVNSANELRIEVELQTILDPCKICQGQIDKFQKIYNAEIKVLSSGAEKTKDLIDLYPKFEVINPKKK